MRIGLFLALWAALAGVSSAQPREYRARRQALGGKLNDGITVLFGRTEKEADDLRTGFFQEPNFYYLTGCLDPGAILLLAPPAREVLFLPRRNPDRERWTGPKLAPDDPHIRQLTGFDTVLPVERFEGELRDLLGQYERLYTLSSLPAAARLQALVPMREIGNAAPALARLRMKKSPEEIARIQRSVDATIDAHLAAWQRIAAGLYEYQIAATMVSTYLDRGCERSAYAPIVGAGPDATVLHYDRNNRRMDRGELLLMDVGAECSGYAADITRTVPVGGKFTKRQREIYQIVLGAQKAVIAAVRPGATLGRNTPNGLTAVALQYFNTHGKDSHGQPLGKYLIHGIGHHLGLDVHDASDITVPLEENMVITVEPGLYLPEENLGVRIEDVVLVTHDGARVMSAALPREPGEIEKAVAR